MLSFRELAMQSAEVIEKVVEKVQLSSTCLFGGVPKVDQKKVLRKGRLSTSLSSLVQPSAEQPGGSGGC